MFTWNFQLISKPRLIDSFTQLNLDSTKGDILIRIHTAAHYADEAVELAAFIKELVPGAMIFGTSTSEVIVDGKLLKDRCVISVTQMNGGTIKTAMLNTSSEGGSGFKSPDELCQEIKEKLVSKDTELLLDFVTIDYVDVAGFADKTNDYFPGVKLIGGIADCQGSNLNEFPDDAFLFDENGWTKSGMLVASISGKNVESLSAHATGVEAIGNDMEITDSLEACLLSFDGNDAGAQYRRGVGEKLETKPEISGLFPYAYADAPEFPVFVKYTEGCLEDFYPEDNPEYKAFYDDNPEVDKKKRRKLIFCNHKVRKGRKVKRAFIYDKKIISDNRAMFRKIEAFKKAETIFAYSCIVRSIIYSNCAKWEISAYENSNMCGCITYGEMVYADGKNVFVNGTFVATVIGERNNNQSYNPYAFIYTEALAYDNEELLKYLSAIEKEFEGREDNSVSATLKNVVRECEQKLLVSDTANIPNIAALNLDVKTKGVDRLCLIDILDTISMKTVYSEHLINITFSNYIAKCEKFAKDNNYNIYYINQWRLAIGAKSYMVTLKEFSRKMEDLQKSLFYNIEEYIPIVPVFSVIDNCTVDNYMNAYNTSKIKMTQKNLQFFVIDAKDLQMDDDIILERYKMVNVINYAIANDKVVPHYQGIYDNQNKCIHHYEALMRLEDEDGTIYYPNSFLDVARTFGILYDRISFMMIKKVLERFKDSMNVGVSINMGMRDIRNKEIVDYIYDYLSVVKHPENFIFELLENEDIDDYNVMINFVDKIHELGGKIAIDDFGSGFSNLQHIISLQSDCIKIDGSIVTKCCESVGAENMIALISTWKSLTDKSIKIVAEYVENEEIQEKVLAYDINYSQGYLFSKPSPDIKVD